MSGGEITHRFRYPRGGEPSWWTPAAFVRSGTMLNAFKLDSLADSPSRTRRIAVAARWMSVLTAGWWIAIQLAAGRMVWLW